MHDCRKTKEELIDLAFNEVDADTELRLVEETEACAACRAEYQAIEEALAKFDEAAPSLLPASTFWAEHHARIESRIADFSGASNTVPFWRRALRTSFSIPVPVAVAAALLLAATSVMAVRSFIFKQDANPLRGQASEAKVQYVEVPVEKRVVEERVVTRTVYVTRKGAQQGGPTQPTIQDIPSMTAQNKDETKGTRTTLNGFQPSTDVKLTFIRGSLNDGK
jgi:anti-sigma factor RsiW